MFVSSSSLAGRLESDSDSLYGRFNSIPAERKHSFVRFLCLLCNFLFASIVSLVLFLTVRDIFFSSSVLGLIFLASCYIFLLP